MNFDFNKIALLYGEDTIKELHNQIDEVKQNIDYLVNLQFTDVEDIFERNTLLFLYDPEDFKKKIDLLINSCGENYVEILETNMELWESVQ